MKDKTKEKKQFLIIYKKSYEIVNSLKISPNNIIISNEANVNRSSLVNHSLNNAKDSYSDYRNLEINDSRFDYKI